MPLYKTLAGIAESFGPDVTRVVQKTGVSFKRNKQFALIQAPSSKRVTLGLNLPQTPSNDRVKETSGMCTHRVDITADSEIDADVTAWLRASYENC